MRWLGTMLAGLALGCAGTFASGRPDWVAGPSAAYPDTAYVIGAAAGSDIDSARSNARAELSRIFHSRVESEVRDSTSATTISDGRGRHSSRVEIVEKLEIDTRVSTEGSFEGVRVVETWRDPSGAWHALAALDKQAMRQSLRVELEAAAARVHGHVEQSDRAPTALGRAKALIEALRASREADVILARARVVGRPPGRLQPSTTDIERDLDSVLGNARFQVRALEVDADTGRVSGSLPKLREQLEKRITGIGFQVVADGQEDANVWVTCRMSLAEIPRDFEGHFFRGEGAYELTGEPPHGPVVLASQASGGESYSTRALARTRALTKGAQKLAGELEGQISRYLRERPDH